MRKQQIDAGVALGEIVGSLDDEVLALNRAGLARIAGPPQSPIAPGATHLLEEPGTLETVSGLPGDWFEAHPGAGATP